MLYQTFKQPFIRQENPVKILNYLKLYNHETKKERVQKRIQEIFQKIKFQKKKRPQTFKLPSCEGWNQTIIN